MTKVSDLSLCLVYEDPLLSAPSKSFYATHLADGLVDEYEEFVELCGVSAIGGLGSDDWLVPKNSSFSVISTYAPPSPPASPVAVQSIRPPAVQSPVVPSPVVPKNKASRPPRKNAAKIKKVLHCLSESLQQFSEVFHFKEHKSTGRQVLQHVWSH